MNAKTAAVTKDMNGTFSQGYDEHRDVHSFPTRRSSDLASVGTRAPHQRTRSSRGHSRARVQQRADGDRSEEHTSELQSQSNLVCRLLLEKKNTNRAR